MTVTPERKSKVVSMSLSREDYKLLEKMRKREKKTRSELFKGMINRYSREKAWEQIFAWGKETGRKFKITSEEDVLKILND